MVACALKITGQSNNMEQFRKLLTQISTGLQSLGLFGSSTGNYQVAFITLK
jgi:hypothetical protein